MEYVNNKIQEYENEIERITALVNLLNSNIHSNRPLVLKLRRDIYNEYWLSRKTSMGRGTPRMRTFNENLKRITYEKLEIFDRTFDVTKDEIKYFEIKNI